jgi:PhoPQ-activated pathogenicity-related protein
VFKPNAEELQFNEDAIYWIDGHDNDDPRPNGTDAGIPFSCLMSNQTQAAVALFRMVPNQPIVYVHDENQEPVYDSKNIAMTWRWALDNNNEQPERVIQYPMVKAAMKGLDVFHDVLQTEYPESDIDEFTVGGGETQGMIAWLLACTDPRVKFLIPLSSSLVNIVENLHTHHQTLGGWSWVLREFWDLNIFAELDTPLFDEMMDPIDPYNYLPRLTMPKLIMAASGDVMFLPDDSHVYYNDLPEPKYKMIVQNAANLYLFNWRKIYGTIVVMFFLMNEPGGVANLPSLTFTQDWNEAERLGIQTMDIDPLPDRVTAWWADTPDEQFRDFRTVDLEGLTDVRWHRWWVQGNGTLEQIDENTFQYTEPESDEAPYKGMMIHAIWHIPRYEALNVTLTLTTEVHIIPDTYPIPPCVGEECQGELV